MSVILWFDPGLLRQGCRGRTGTAVMEAWARIVPGENGERVLMRWCVAAILFGLMWAASSGADENLRQAEIAAATANARASLREDILSTVIRPGVTVEDVVSRSGNDDSLRQTVAQAEPVGGTRWIDDQTCQVQVEIDGSSLQKSILAAAQQHPERLPLTLAALQERLASWKNRSFAATGTSTALAAAEQLHPSEEQRSWAGVSEEQRRQAIAAARSSAVTRVLDSVRPITMVDGKTLGEAMEQPAVNSAVVGWLRTRPIASIEFRDDLEVRLSLAVLTEDFWKILKAALPKQRVVAVPSGPAGWDRLHEQVERRIEVPIGRSVIGIASPATAASPVVIPARPPEWVNQTVDAEGIARSRGRLLRTARVAEALAHERLASKVDDLPLSPGLTVGKAARSDPRIAEAVSRALGRAHPFKVDYDYPDTGSVRVKVTLDLDDLWRELADR